MMLYGLKEGLRMGAKIGVWTAAFYGAEAAVDGLRCERRDVMSTVVAGLGIAGAWSAWNGMSVAMAAKNARMGLLGGVVYGFGQDAVSLLKGRRLRYVDFLLGRGVKRSGEASLENI